MPLSSEPAFAASPPQQLAAVAGPLFGGAAAAHKWSAARAAGSCVQVMRAGSPPRSKKTSFKDAAPENCSYSAWLFRHPSALTAFDELLDSAKGRKIALFLDYDGTLSPIVENPDRAFMSSEMREAVREVARLLPTSIITGRSRDKVFEFVQLPELFYAGSHGMDIIGPASGVKASGVQITEDAEGNKMVSFQPAAKYLPTMSEVRNVLEKRMSFISGARVEDNKFCLSVHYRQVSEEDWQFLAEEVERVLDLYPELNITHGRKVLEIRPAIKWDKGKAVEYLLEALDLGDVLPIYIGDDRTDEDAFNVLNDKFNGYGVLVSSTPKTTSATYSLQDTSEVQEFLKLLAESQD